MLAKCCMIGSIGNSNFPFYLLFDEILFIALRIFDKNHVQRSIGKIIDSLQFSISCSGLHKVNKAFQFFRVGDERNLGCDGLNIYLLPWDGFQHLELVSVNIQAEKVHSGPVERQKDRIKRETLNGCRPVSHRGAQNSLFSFHPVHIADIEELDARQVLKHGLIMEWSLNI